MTTAIDPALLTRRCVDSPLGLITLVGTGAVVHRLWLEGQAHAPRVSEHWREDSEGFDSVVAQLAQYFAGHSRSFDVDLDAPGTDFQHRVWSELATIPCGETRTYGQIAESIGAPHAARAVGMAAGRNPIALIIPCHRVIGANGSLVGYAGGLDRKARLLAFERSGDPRSLGENVGHV